MNKINAFFLCIFVFVSGCGGGDSNTNSTSEDITITYTIKDSSSNLTNEFTVGEDVIIEVRFINNTSSTVSYDATLPFPPT